MTKAEQIEFVKSLTETIAAECCRTIRLGCVPDNFDGHELRVWLSDKFKVSAQATQLRRHPHSKRNMDYNNWKAITPEA